MGMIEVQGIVAMSKGLPFVQFRQLDDDDEVIAKWQVDPLEAREFAQKIVEASINAVYDAAMIAWAKEVWPHDEALGPRMLMAIRDYRSDIWGLPARPDDWRIDGS